jgi:hypothetical protein
MSTEIQGTETDVVAGPTSPARHPTQDRHSGAARRAQPVDASRQSTAGREAERVEEAKPSRARLADALAGLFRLPGADDPAPDARRLAGVCGWAGALGLGGAPIAIRLLLNLFQVDGGWYGPTIIVIGLVGLLATVGAFASLHRGRLPWIMLGVGTIALAAATLVTAVA